LPADGVLVHRRGVNRKFAILNIQYLMPFIETGLPDLLVYEPLVFEDSRGFFYESYNQKIFGGAGVETQFVQDNQSRSTYGVIRGLHYQVPPYAMHRPNWFGLWWAPFSM
jgi:dTDP-4-dehydrorhamnose 3,5-epimerase-like enzyme